MATTTNFGWETPDDTDLVKDGAAAIRTALGGVDTSFVDLKGGTTGQVLAKASGTDLDYTWTTPATGSTYVAGKNAIINGAFDIWQRGTSGTIAAGSYVAADRFYTYRNTTGSTFSRQSASLTGFQYSGRIARDSGNTATANISVGQSIETVNSIPLAGQTVTFSFYAKAGSNFSATSNVLRARLLSSTTENQNIVLNGGTSVIDQNVTLTTSWQRFSYSGSVGSTALTVGVIFGYDPTGTAGAADNFEITGVQVEIASSATAFARAGGTIQGELAACQRYYQAPSLTPAALMIYGGSASGGFSANAYNNFTFPVQMRTTPTVTFYAHDGSAGQVTLYVSSSAIKSTSVASIGLQPWGWSGNFSGTGWGTNADSGLLAYGYKAEAEL